MSAELTIAPGDKRFRTDINGLRTWAVSAVVLYHFQISGFTGGFAGVDVFFVISGFLMAGIIYPGLETGRFSLWEFYLARARRILPALMVVVAAVMATGWFLLMPNEYQLLGKHARESLLFTSNLLYLSEAGYFDAASHTKWLLHTWSLSVEWQFYAIYPVLLIGLHKHVRSHGKSVVAHVIALAISLLGCVILTFHHPDKAFYWLPTRAWELLLGSCIFLTSRQFHPSLKAARSLELAGICLLLASFTLLDPSMPWPGAWAIMPVAGAGLILLASRSDSRWTGNGVAQWLGERSYSIYLWHWPLVVGLVYFEQFTSLIWKILAILLTCVLGHVSLFVVEHPSRRWLAKKRATHTALLILSGVVALVLAAQAIRASGLPARLPEQVRQIEKERHNKNPRQDECLNPGAHCVFGGAKIAAIVIGDSHGDALVTAVEAALPDTAQGVLFRGANGCLFVQGAQWAGTGQSNCEAFRKDVLDKLPSLHPGKPVILLNRSSFYALGETENERQGKPAAPAVFFTEKRDGSNPVFQEEFRNHYLDTVCALTKTHPTYLLRPIPEMPDHVPRAIGRELLRRGQAIDIKITRDAYEARHGFVRSVQDEAAKRCGAQLLDPLPYLCDHDYCYGSVDGFPIYVDDDHLSERGNRLLVPMFAAVFKTGHEGSPAANKAPQPNPKHPQD